MADQTPETKEEREARWWRGWWAADYAWEGLAKKEIIGGGQWGEKNLQDYWRRDPHTGKSRTDDALREANELIQFDRRLWHVAHLPVRSRSGSKETWKADQNAAMWTQLDAILSARLAVANETDGEFNFSSQHGGHVYLPIGVDKRARFDGASLLGGQIFSSRPSSDDSPYHHINLSSAFVIGDLNLSVDKLGPGADFGRTIFGGSVDFEYATFSGRALFSEAIFLGTADFEYATFEEKVEFYGSVFCHGVDFSGAVFRGELNFVQVNCLNPSYFFGTKFFNNVAFNMSNFLGGSRFGDVVFKGKASFNDAVFSDYSSFDGSTFRMEASLDGVKFSGGVSFDGASFTNRASFTSVIVAGTASFLGVKFDSHLIFNGAQFGDGADFDGAMFSSLAIFDNVHFTGSATFNRAVFSGLSLFSRASFSSEASFNGVMFTGDAGFDSAMFKGRASFGDADGLRTVFAAGGSFRDSIFERSVAFEATVERPETGFAGAFYGARFADIADFSKAGPERPNDPSRNDGARMAIALAEALFEKTLILTDGTDRVATQAFRRGALATVFAEAPERREDLLDRLEAGCRTVKIAMGKARDEVREQRYYRFQLQARQARADTHWSEKFVGGLYGVFSGYGGSLGRPLAYLLGGTAVMGLLYWLWAGGMNGSLFRDVAAIVAAPLRGESWANLAAGLNFSTGRSLFISAWLGVPDRDPTTWQWIFLNGYGPGWGFLVRIVAALQSIASGVLIFLFALAVRRRFQIGG